MSDGRRDWGGGKGWPAPLVSDHGEPAGPVGGPCPEDHEILDAIVERLRHAPGHVGMRRESECIEFRDARTGQWYEIVVRPIDDPEPATA